MTLPFTLEQFFDVFGKYNQAVWPMQILLYLLAAIAIFLTFRKSRWSDKVVSAILGFLWIWIGLVYHIIYFSTINKPAYLFGILFIIQGLIFLYFGIAKSFLSFKYITSTYSIIGSIFMLYALIIYPILGHLLGHIYPKTPTFGLPCPTTIFTFGILLCTDKRVPKYVIVIPLLWSVIGSTAAIKLTILQDYGLFISGILGTFLLFLRDKN